MECEVQVMKKIQRQIAKYHSKQRGGKALDLQIAEVYQALDMRNSGKLSRKQVKGIMTSIGKPQSISGYKSNIGFVADSDINAIMRRMDSDGDEQISFSDFF